MKFEKENHRETVFPIQYAHAGAGKSAFSIFGEKAGNLLNFTKFMKILEISINLVKKSSFLP